MKIAARAEVKKEVFDKYQDALKSELRANVSNELMKHNVFIEPPMNERNGIVSMEMHFFALSYSDIDKLRELTEKYPEIKSIIADILDKKIRYNPNCVICQGRGFYIVDSTSATQPTAHNCDCHIFYDIKENSQDLDTDIVDMVNEEFWNLI